MKWPSVQIDQVAQVNPRLPKDIDETQIVSFIGMASVSEDGKLLSEEDRILAETKKGFTYFTREDVLLAKITPCFENGKSLHAGQIGHEIGFGSTEFHVIRANPEELDSKYLFYLIWNDSFRFYGRHSMSGAAGQKRVSTDFIKKLKIPLPPLREQKRIAAILDKAETLRRKRQQAIQLADEFLRAVFLDMFGDPETNPKNWSTLPIGDLTYDWRGGSSMKPEDFAETGFPVLHKGAIHRNGKVSIDGRKKTHVSEEYARKNSRSIVDREYMVVTLRDLVPTGPSIGLVADLSRYNTPQYMLSQGAYGFRVDTDKLVPSFLVALSNSPGFRLALARIWVGSTQIHIRNGDFKDLEVPLPDLALLEKYQKIVDATQARLDCFSEFSSLSNDLFSSVSSSAFSGKL